MSAPGPVDIVVDLDGLDRLRERLVALIGALDTLPKPDRDGTDAHVMGHADVAAAVERFRDRWGQGAGRIERNLGACLTYLDNALAYYRGVEAALQAQLCPPGEERRPLP